MGFLLSHISNHCYRNPLLVAQNFDYLKLSQVSVKDKEDFSAKNLWCTGLFVHSKEDVRHTQHREGKGTPRLESQDEVSAMSVSAA